MYYKKTIYKFIKFEKSRARGKMYAAILENKHTRLRVRVNFGDSKMENYHDKTGLNLYPHLIHGDRERRRLFRTRHKGFLKSGYYSPSYFSFYFLW